jgi:hypothetical protein
MQLRTIPPQPQAYTTSMLSFVLPSTRVNLLSLLAFAELPLWWRLLLHA